MRRTKERTPKADVLDLHNQILALAREIDTLTEELVRKERTIRFLKQRITEDYGDDRPDEGRTPN